MSWFDDVVKNPFKTAGTIAGGIAGGVAGLPGMVFGGKKAGSVGGLVDGAMGFGGGGGSQDYYSGMPNYPTYTGMEPGSFELSGQFMGPNAPQNKFINESMRNGPSDMTKFALQQNAQGAVAGRDQARKMASGMAQDQQAQLSMKGGLGAGAAERIQKYSTNVGMDGANIVDANAGKNRANLLVADDAARMGNLQSAAGMFGDQQKMGYDMRAGDLTRKQGEYDRRNLFNSNLYNQQMAGWAAGKQANATANSGGKKS